MRIEDLASYTPDVIGYGERKEAAVLIPLIQEGEEWSVLFQVRSAKLKSQPGDVCFPGGGRKPEELPVETAIRETCEELLVKREQIRVIGPSDWFSANNLTVRVYVGELMDYQNSYSEEEVSEVFQVPLNWFLSHDPDRYVVSARMEFPEDFPFEKVQRGKDYKWGSRKEEMLFWEYEGHVIWGLSARILWAFLRVLRDESGQGPQDSLSIS